MAEIKGNKLFIDGFTYLKSRTGKGRVYWDCARVRQRQCSARAITNQPKAGEPLLVLKGPTDSAHLHPPSQEEVQAIILTQTLKKKAADHPGQPPAQILRTELAGVSLGVLSQMPEREALSRAMRRERRKNLPSNPTSLAAMGSVPTRFAKTLLGEKFLIYDSRAAADEDVDSDPEVGFDEEEEPARVLVYSTARNIELLCQSPTWFVDGTFKTSPSIFTQIFAIMGLRMRQSPTETEGVALPMVYAFLSHKTEAQYTQVLEAVRAAVTEFNVPGQCVPQRIMSDFEKGILNACKTVYPQAQVRACFFHLGQSVFARIQQEGLQCAYNNKDDRRIKDHTHMLLAVAFVPLADVPATFRMLSQAWRTEDDFKPMIKYFDKTYVNGTPRRGNRAAVRPRYPPTLWNQYNAAISKLHRTNNVSEAWHNRFQVVVGKHHPDVYSALQEIQKEQGDTESMVAELSLGRKVKAAPRQKWITLQERIQTVATEYEDYKANDDVMEYLRIQASNIHM